jgi:tubulin polyglutamylase TTLL9
MSDVLSQAQACVVSTYISNPLLLNGSRKFDIRLYVMVLAGAANESPRAFVFDDGIVRFAAQPYNFGQNLEQHSMHLTNFSVQKGSSAMFEGSEFEVKSSWSKIAAALENETGTSADTLWVRMSDLLRQVVQSFNDSFLSKASCTSTSTVCRFALFGFDVMIDDDGRPWLLEVNAQPSLAVNTAADQTVKIPLVAAMVSLLMAQGNGGWQNLNCKSTDFGTSA